MDIVWHKEIIPYLNCVIITISATHKMQFNDNMDAIKELAVIVHHTC